MLLIFGVTLDENKRISEALPKLFGLGKPKAIRICNEIGLSPNLKIKDLIPDQQYLLAKKVKEEYRVEETLREEIKSNIRRYMTNGSIRGFRHRHHLPVRGQRTHSNGKTPRRVILGFSTKSSKRKEKFTKKA